VYWLEVYALIAGAIFAAAGLCILVVFVSCELAGWLGRTSSGLLGEPAIALDSHRDIQRARIGISIAIPNPVSDLDFRQ
jgi:hypothetical protein